MNTRLCFGVRHHKIKFYTILYNYLNDCTMTFIFLSLSPNRNMYLEISICNKSDGSLQTNTSLAFVKSFLNVTANHTFASTCHITQHSVFTYSTTWIIFYLQRYIKVLTFEWHLLFLFPASIADMDGTFLEMLLRTKTMHLTWIWFCYAGKLQIESILFFICVIRNVFEFY